MDWIERSQGAVTASAVVPDLQVVEDRVGHSILVRQLCRSSSSTCIRDQNASIIELSKQSPTLPIEGTNPEALARSVKAQEPNWAGSTGRCNTGLL
jgi:hypothetical protein